jgi:hypothetical protein
MPISQNLWVQPNLDDAAVTYISNLYPLMQLENLDLVHMILAGSLYTWLPGEIDLSHALVSGVLSQPLLTYNNWPVENIDLASHALSAGSLVLVLKTYNNWPVESIDAAAHDLVSGTLVTVLFTYSNWPVESMDTSHGFTAGSLV